MRRRIAAVCLPLLATIATAQAPPGFKTYENKQSRLTFYYPVAYSEIPVPPTEQVVVAEYVMKALPDELKKFDKRGGALMPEISAFCFDAAGATTGKPQTDDVGKPATLREAMESGSRVTTWKEFVTRFGERWSLAEVAKKPGHWELRWTDQTWPDAKPCGYMVVKQEGNSTFGAYGFSMTPHQKALEAHVTKMVGGMALQTDDAGDMAAEAIDRLYASGKFRAVEARKKARASLAKGWKAVDTENFLIVHHSTNEGLIRRIAREIEAMRTLYSQHFPAAAPVDALAVVRVCRTKDEYHQYGGPPSTGGYWHPGNEELVFFDYSYTMKTLDDDERKRMNGRVLTSDDSLLVLYHEAMHQYMYYAVGEFSPHDWFNEGYGDYYSGAVLNDNTAAVQRIDPSPWRIHLAKDMCEFGDGFIPLEKVLRAERAEFYNPARAGHYYAAAWSFVYFLKTSKEAAAVPEWSGLLQTYFDAVKAAYREELAAIEKDGAKADLEGKMRAGMLARGKALKRTLTSIDLPKLEATWRKWVVDMRDPWPSKRQKRK